MLWAEVRQWLARAKAQPRGMQRVFPELDLLISTKACVAPAFENPWFVVREPSAYSDGAGGATASAVAAAARGKASDMGVLLGTSSGVEIAMAFGAI